MWQLTMHCHLRTGRRDVIANVKSSGAPGHQRLNFDRLIYVHYAVYRVDNKVVLLSTVSKNNTTILSTKITKIG